MYREHLQQGTFPTFWVFALWPSVVTAVFSTKNWLLGALLLSSYAWLAQLKSEMPPQPTRTLQYKTLL